MSNTRLGISRRSILALSPIGLAACRTDSSDYFGRTKPPSDQLLVFENGDEPGTLDPPLSTGGPEANIVHALFEGLTTYHPRTLQPMAGLATHCKVDSSETRYIFYLRGHPIPAGEKLPNTDTLRHEYHDGQLPQDFSRGRAAPPDDRPARWSDGRLITAHDFVYS
jgi:ABC-type oligopeptide transport system substrate-binding subunit